MVKWFQSANKPTADIIVIIDPDNWIMRDISHWVKRVLLFISSEKRLYFANSFLNFKGF